MVLSAALSLSLSLLPPVGCWRAREENEKTAWRERKEEEEEEEEEGSVHGQEEEEGE